MLIGNSTFRVGATRRLIPNVLAFLGRYFRVIVTGLLRIAIDLLGASREENCANVCRFALANFRASGDANVSNFLLGLVLTRSTVNCEDLVDGELIRLCRRVILRILKGATTIANDVASGAVLLQGCLRVETLIGNVSGGM